MADITFTIARGDVHTFPADVLALKHAQEFYGADDAVMTKLAAAGVSSEDLRAPPGEYRIVATKGALAAARVMWLGVPRLRNVGYGEVLGIGSRAVSTLAAAAPDCRHLALTTHGPGFGLDEVEATLSLIAGIRSSVHAGNVPKHLERITVVERNARRVERLRAAVEPYLGDDARVVRAPDDWSYRLAIGAAGTREARPVKRPLEPPHAFVAMPFTKEMEDVFYYGIHGPVRRAGLLCERVDQDIFAGDILARIKSRIETAAVVIGDLSLQNANVYLEVGYAWGREVPTVLVVNDIQCLKFDVQGQRCLVYGSIRNLEEQLDRELAHLAEKHRWPAAP